MNGRRHHTHDWCLSYHTDTLTYVCIRDKSMSLTLKTKLAKAKRCSIQALNIETLLNWKFHHMYTCMPYYSAKKVTNSNLNIWVIENSRHTDPAEDSQDRVYLFWLSCFQLQGTRHLASKTLQFSIAHLHTQ